MTEALARLHWVVRSAIVAGTVVAAVTAVPSARAQARPDTSASKTSTPATPVFPDEFSDLDEGTQTSVTWDEGVIEQLEFARRRYLKALSAIESKDTTEAAKEFERAIVILNDLASYPRIEENGDFSDLAQSIVEDYETYIRNIDDLDENASVFLLRERIFEEVDRSKVAGTVEALSVPRLPKPDRVPETVIPLTVNEEVEKEMAFLMSANGRKFLKKWIERTGRWFTMLRTIAAEEQMPEEIIHLAMIESGLSPKAVSRAKAVGMWQFMQPTGKDYDLDVTFWHDERRDPEKATRAAMRYLKDLHADLGDWHLALAAYNCGPGNVRRAIRKTGLAKPSYWEVREHLPRETRKYVPLYIATTLITMNRDQYGFPNDSLSFHPAWSSDVVAVNEPCNLSALASCAGISVDSLRDLNPELVRTCTPPSNRAYPLKVPVGTASTFQQRYALLSDDEKRPWMVHKVDRGETLAGIARRYSVSADEIAAVNGLRGYNARLRRGSTIRVPVGAPSVSLTAAPAPATASPVPTPTVAATASETTPRTAAATRSAPAAARAAVHVVQNGENLSSIARRYGVRVTDLRTWNELAFDNDAIHAGDTLTVSVTDIARAGTSSVERLAVKRTVTHTVLRGENLESIAAFYGTTTDRLRDLNRLGRRATVKAGAELRVETSLSKSDLAAVQRGAPTGKAITHKVRKGENLSGIAALYGVDERDVRRWNADVVDGSTVFSGTRIKIYTADSQKGSNAPSTAKRPPKTYKVRRGDNLSGIAEKFGLSVESIRAKNRALRTTTALRTGQVIRLQ